MIPKIVAMKDEGALLRAADRQYRQTCEIAGVLAEEAERILREELVASPGFPLDAREAARLRVLNGEGAIDA